MTFQDFVLLSENIYEAKIHPTVITQILDCFLRQPQDKDRTIGTLLGRIENNVVYITNSFAVPYMMQDDQMAIRQDFNARMYELNQRVNEQEIIVGWYASTSDYVIAPGKYSCSVQRYYGSLCDSPIHLVVDTSLKHDNLQISAFVTPTLNVSESLSAQSFKQIQVSHAFVEPEIIALSSMAANQGTELSEHKELHPICNDLETLEYAVEKLYTSLQAVSDYVDNVVQERIPLPQAGLGHEITNVLNSIPLISQEQMNRFVNDGLQDLLMTSYLSVLTKAQLSISEKLIQTSV